MLSPNAIERTLRDPNVIKHHGAGNIKRLIDRLLKEIPLDEQSDSPLPRWAIDILREREIGYRTRFKMVFMHHFDITNENPDYARVQPSDVRKSPPLPPPNWLIEFRRKQANIAKEYIEKKEKENRQ